MIRNPSREDKQGAGVDGRERPRPLTVLAERIAAELKALPQWVTWAYVEVVDDETGEVDWDKPPLNARTRHAASSTNNLTWSTFPVALDAYNRGGLDGLGFCLDDKPDDAGEVLVGVDLDHCRDPKTGRVKPWAQKIIDLLDSYSEVSPSGTGVRIFIWARPLARGRKKGPVEVYCRGRYLTVTGNVVGDPRPIARRQEALDAFMAEHFPEPKAEPAAQGGGTPTDLDDARVIEKATAARNGAGPRFAALWCGDTSGYASHSEADLALCSYLRFWCGRDAERIDVLFRQSGLFRGKWNRADYRERTIAKALPGDVYELGRSGSNGCHAGGVPAQAGPAAPPPSEPTPWPSPPDEAAYHGLAGDLVRAIDPHSEADPVALLVQLLTAFGNVIGRKAHYLAEGDAHHTNEFVVLVGKTGKGRKGTSWGQVRKFFEIADEFWSRDRVQGGASSGEGLIWAVRDPITSIEKIKDRGRTVRTEEVETDPGVADKRLLLYEPEFASVLKQLERQGNILSTLIRQAWDTGSLRTLTKNSPARATGALVSILGHITAEELRRYLTATESANGFANRFLWVCVQRSKALPFGGRVPAAEFEALRRRLSEAILAAGDVGAMGFDADASEAWAAVYEDLSDGKPGLAGAMLSRSEAHVVRLSLIYALLDQSPEIRVEHLKAALAVWEYCERSVHHVFGDSTGDPVADDILRALRAASAGLKREELRELFSRNRRSGEIGRALQLLQGSGLAHSREEETGGRPATRWFAGKAT